jgi:glycerophosphoryl diester phosphodiesterase
VVLSRDKYFHSRYSSHPDGTAVTPDEPRTYLYEMPYGEVVRWDVGSRFNPAWPEKGCMPAVKPLAADVISAVEAWTKANGHYPMHYDIEIKSDPDSEEVVEGVNWTEYHEFTDLCMEVLESLNLGDRLMIQCFDERALNYIHEKYPGQRRRVAIRGSAISSEIVQINMAVSEYGPKSIEDTMAEAKSE